MKNFFVYLVALFCLAIVILIVLAKPQLGGMLLLILLVYIVLFFIWVVCRTRGRYSRFIDFLVNTFNGKIIKNTRSEKQISFEFAGRLFDYSLTETNILSELWDKNFIKVPTKTSLSLVIWRKTGESIVGKTTDKIIATFSAQSCKEIAITEISLFNNRRIYTSDEIKARFFLSDPEVRRIISEYDYLFTPIYIENGILIYDLDLLRPEGIFCNPELLRKHLSNMKGLADKLDFPFQ